MKPLQKYGVDIGVSRSDDLDISFLEQLSKKKNQKVINIGSGGINQTKKMRESGAIITSVDIIDFSEEYRELQEESKGIEFMHSNALDFLRTIPDQTYELACAQRMIHYLSYPQAKELLEELRRTTKHSLHISVTGLGSAIGFDYRDKHKEVAERFSPLLEEEQKKFHITEPVCLYTRDEFRNLLMETGWGIEKIWTSAFGNHKAVCINHHKNQ